MEAQRERPRSAGRYREVCRSKRFCEADVNDMHPMRALPALPSTVAELQQVSLPYGTKSVFSRPSRRERRPTSPPPKMCPPVVRPHNSWRTYLEWVPPADSEADAAFGYEVNCRMEGSEGSWLLDGLGSVPQANLDGLEAGRTFCFQVRAKNAAGAGPWSHWSTGYLVPEALPLTSHTKGFPAEPRRSPEPPKGSSTLPTSITVDWEEPCGNGAQILGYRVQYGLNPDDPDNIVTIEVLNRRTSVTLENLLPNQIYYFRTCALNELGASDWTPWSDGLATKAVEPEAPPAPVLMEAKQRELVVSWKPPFAYGFQVLRYDVRIACEDSTMSTSTLIPVEDVADGKFDKQSIRIKDLSPSTAYYFQVRAVSAMGASAWSEPSEALRTTVAVPAACEDVWVTKNVFGSISLQWMAPVSYGLPITGFVVRWLDTADSQREQHEVEVLANEHTQTGSVIDLTFNGITPGSRLCFEAAARNRAGLGPFSPSSCEVLACPGVPNPPERPVCRMRTSSSIVIGVEDNTQDNGDPISAYELQWSMEPDMSNAVRCRGAMRLVCEPSGDEPRRFELALSGLTRKCKYFFQVRARNGVGMSPWSEVSAGQILRSEAPSKLSAPCLVEAWSSTCLIIGYTPPVELGSRLGGAILEYELRCTQWPRFFEMDEKTLPGKYLGDEKVHSLCWSAPQHTGSPDPVSVGGLITGCLYFFQIRAISEIGVGVWSDCSAPFETLPSPPDKPPPPTVVPGTESPYSVNLRMLIPRDNGRAVTTCMLRVLGPTWRNWPPATEWRMQDTILPAYVDVERIGSRELVQDEALELGGSTFWNYTLLHLEPGASYQFMYSCTNAVGVSEWGDPSDPITTAPTVPDQCQAPYLENENDLTTSSLTLRWSAPHDGGSDIRHYTLRWASNPRFQGFKTMEAVTGTHITFDQLSPNQWYYVQVAAMNDVGLGKFSEYDAQTNVGCFLTLADVPGPVLNVAASLDDEDHVLVKWDKPTQNGGRLVTRYRVAYSRFSNFESKEGEVMQKAHRQCRLTDLSPDTVYFFDVSAANSVGYGAMSGQPAQLHTKPLPPTRILPPVAPGAPNCVVVGGGTVQVKWACPEMFDKKLGFIYKPGLQTHMILHYNVQLMAGSPDPAAADQLQSREGVQQIRDRRTVPKDEHNTAEFDELLPGAYYYATVQSVSGAGVSGWSEPSEGVRTSPSLPDVVQEINCVSRTSASLKVEWICPYGNGEDVDRFYLRWRRDSVSDGAANIDTSDVTWADDRSSSATDTGGEVDSGPLGLMVMKADCLCGDAPPQHVRRQPASTSDLVRCKPIYLTDLCSFEILDLMPGRYYSIDIRPRSIVGLGPWCHSGPLRTASTVPDAPTMVRGVPGSATTTSVAFGWGAPEERGGEEILGYEVRWLHVEYRGCPITELDTIVSRYDARKELSPDVLEYRVEGLNPGETAMPIVRCWNSVGYSQWCRLPAGTAELDLLTTLPAVPSQLLRPPALERVTQSGNQRPYALKAHWTCPRLNGLPVKHFVLRISRTCDDDRSADGPGELVRELHVKHSDPEQGEGAEISLNGVHEGLIPGAPYVMNVKAVSQIGEAEGWGASSLPERAPPDYPLRPDPVKSTWQWPTALEVQWSEPCMSGAPLERVAMRYSLSPSMSNVVNIPDSDKASLDKKEVFISNLECMTAYYVQFRVANVVGWSPWTVPSDALMTKACRPARPDMPVVVELTMRTLQMRWKPPREHGSAITGYDVILADGSSTLELQAVMDNANSLIDIKRPCDSEVAQRALIQAVPPKFYTHLAVNDLNDPSRPDHLFGELLGGIPYAAGLRAHNKEGPSDWSQVLTVVTPCGEPEQCVPLMHLDATQTTLHVEYRLPYDNGDPITSLEFLWIRVTGPLDKHLATTAQSTSVCSATVDVALPVPAPQRAPPHGIGGCGTTTITGLEPGTEYTVQVRAENSYGRGSFSDVVHMICSAGKPDAPGKIRHVSGTTARSARERGFMCQGLLAGEEPPTIFLEQSRKLPHGEVASVTQPGRQHTSVPTNPGP